MVILIKYLHKKDLAIFRLADQNKPYLDMIFYIYNEIERDEIGLEDLKRNYGILLIERIKKFLKDIEKEHYKLIKNIVLKIEEESKIIYEKDVYQLFWFLLFIKLALRKFKEISYKKDLIYEFLDILKDEEGIAYEFGQYLLKEWNYDRKLGKDILDIINDRERFIIYYGIIKDTLKSAKLNKKIIYMAYNDLKMVFGKN